MGNDSKFGTNVKGTGKYISKMSGKSVEPDAHLGNPPKPEKVRAAKHTSAPRDKAMGQSHHVITRNGK